MQVKSRFNRKNSWRRLAFSPLAVMVLATIAFFLVSAAWHAWGKERLAQERLEAARHERDALLLRQEALVSELDMLESERGREALLRDQYDVGREGEELIVIVNERPKAPVPVKEPSAFEAFLGIFE